MRRMGSSHHAPCPNPLVLAICVYGAAAIKSGVFACKDSIAANKSGKLTYDGEIGLMHVEV
jgi:hypothetical protein